MILTHPPSSIPPEAAAPNSRVAALLRGRRTPHGRLFLLTIAAVALPAALLTTSATPRYTPYPWWVTVFIFPLGITLGLLATILIHESGHYLAARRAGFRILSVAVGPLQWTQTPAGGRWHDSGLGAIQGFVLAVPPADQIRDEHQLKDWHGRYRQLLLGGPIASLMQAVVLTAGLFLLPTGAIDQMVRAGWVAFALLAWLYAAWSAVPMQIGGQPNDAARARHTRPTDPAARRTLALLALTAESAAGRRPADWSAHLLRRAHYPPDWSGQQLTGLLYAYDHALDRGEIEVAALRLDEALDIFCTLSPQRRPPAVLWAAAHLEAVHGDPAVAADWWKMGRRAGPTQQPDMALIYHRAAAEVAHLSGETDTAVEHAHRARALLPHTYQRATAQTIGAWADAFLARHGRTDAPPTATPPGRPGWRVGGVLLSLYLMMFGISFLILLTV